MNEATLAKVLIEQGGDPALNKKVAVFFNRLRLRIFSVPSLMGYLASVCALPDEEAGEGSVKIQLDFLRLPEEIMPQVQRLLAAPTKADLFRYIKDGQARVGIELKVNPKDLKGEDYEYAM